MRRFIFLLLVLLLSSSILVVSADEPTEDNPLPVPTGEYQVGATFRQWIDESREEPFTANPDDKRLLSAWIYYPADVPEDVEPMPYLFAYTMDDKFLLPILETRLANRGQDFEEVYGFVSQWQSYAFLDAPVSSKQSMYPIIIFTNANPQPAAHMTLAIELASHGYIVFDLINVYGNYSFSFNHDGTELIIGDFTTNFDDYSKLCVEDTLFMLEIINMPNNDDMLSTRLDYNSIGILGQSIGGGIAWQSARKSEQIKVGVGLDGDFMTFLPLDLPKPFMYLFQDQSMNPTQYYRVTEMAAYSILIDDFEHGTFSDWMFWSYMENLIPQTMTAKRAHEVYSAYVVAFYDEYLKGAEQLLLDGLSEDFPEVTSIESKNTD